MTSSFYRRFHWLVLPVVLCCMGTSVTACQKKSKKKSTNTAQQTADGSGSGEGAGGEGGQENPQGGNNTNPPPTADVGPGVGDLDGSDMNPLPTLAPQDERSLPRMMDEVARLIYGFDVVMDSYQLDGVSIDGVEQRASDCYNEEMRAVRFQADSRTVGPSGLFSNCASNITGVTQPYEIRMPEAWSFSHRCSGDSSGVVLAGAGLAGDLVSRGYCELGQSAKFRFQAEVEVRQGPNLAQGQATRYYKRLIATTDTARDACGWDWQSAERIKRFRDCVFLDRVDLTTGRETQSLRFVRVRFDRVFGHTSSTGGHLYTEGRAEVIYNNWKGEIIFNGNNSPSWTMTADGTDRKLTGSLNVPAGHGVMPTAFPGDLNLPSGGLGGGNIADDSSYRPISGTEQRCASIINPDNFVQGNGVVVTHTNDLQQGTIYTGYVHENQDDLFRAFVARVDGATLSWCRTYHREFRGVSRGHFSGFVGEDLFVVMSATQDVLPSVGSVYLPNHPAPGREVAYIARVDPRSGNVRHATWFDFDPGGGGSFAMPMIDDRNVGMNEIRLRAFLTGSRGPGCQSPGTGDYGMILQRDLGGTVGSQAIVCP